MSETKTRAERLIKSLGPKVDVTSVKSQFSNDENDWYRLSTKAYQIHIQNAQKQRNEDEKKQNVSCTSNSEIAEIIQSNNKLANYALCLPTTSTMAEFRQVKTLLEDMPNNEHKLVYLVESAVLDPRIRALQKKGRFEHFSAFKEFVHLIEAATICYFRGNYISSYMTLMPVTEGIMLRWMGYKGDGEKPEFDELRKFFSQAHIRQPCPGNPLFHQVYTKACDKILNEHLYKPSKNGPAHANFNRHLAAHLLNQSQFATRENCVRLFLLLDIMSELYLYETFCGDPRFYLSGDDIATEYSAYQSIKFNHMITKEPEQQLLGNAQQ
jgi:hypothetical protein